MRSRVSTVVLIGTGACVFAAHVGCDGSDDTGSTFATEPDGSAEPGPKAQVTDIANNEPTTLLTDAGGPPPLLGDGDDAGVKEVMLFGGTRYPGGAATSERIPVTAMSTSCGDGIRGIADEACDDGPDETWADGGIVEDSCAADCTVQDLLAVLPGESDGVDRYLGEGRHPAAATFETSAVVFVEPDVDVGRIGMRRFSATGARIDSVIDVSEGTTPVLFANPVAAGLPGGGYAVAWTDFGGDGDELGVALRKVDETGSVGSVRYANTGTDFSQGDPDVLWTDAGLVVAWVDYAGAFAGPDIVYRVFDESLDPDGGEVVLAATDDREDNVALAPFQGGWAAAWRVGLADPSGTETVRATVGDLLWEIDTPFLGGPMEDRPALLELDETHLLVVFTEGTDPDSLGIADTARLRGAIIDTTETGDGSGTAVVASFPIDPRVAPYDADVGLSQSRPGAMRVGGYLYVSWQSERVLSDSRGDELWLKPLRWDGSSLDSSIDEVRIPRQTAHHEADQRFPALAATPLGPFGALLTAWDDLGRTFHPNQGTPDIGAALLPVPLFGQEPPIDYVGCTAGELLVRCDGTFHCAEACNGTVGDRPGPGDEDLTCTLSVSDLFGEPLSEEQPGTSCGACPPGEVSCFGQFCFAPCDGVVECGQDIDGKIIDDESSLLCGAPG